MKRQRSRRGFTLAETLAALVVVVLLAMSVQIGTMTALRARTVSRFQSESEILAATDHYYRRTGTLYALIVVAIGIVYPMVVHFTLPRGVVLLYTILYGLPSVTSFFVQGKYRLLMDVDGRRYVLSNLETATNLISGIGKVLVLMLTRNILAMQGPFSQELNEALIRQYHIAWVVTKDGGTAGGFPEKARAAETTGAELIVLCRPEDQGEDLASIVKLCEEMMR